MNPGPSARLFVAAWPPAVVLDVLEQLPRPPADGVRYTTRAQWHVTVRFLGTCAIADALAAFAAVRAPRADAVLGPVVSRLGRSVVAVPVHGLDTVAARVVAATASIGAAPDPRPFAGHVTLARLQGRAACGVAGAPVHAQFSVEQIHLVRSTTHAGGAVYETLATRELDPPTRAELQS